MNFKWLWCWQCDSAQQLNNVRQLRVVKYHYDPEFSNHCGLDTESDTGIIAQELRNILPEAVIPAGDIVLPSGTRIDNFLVVNKVSPLPSHGVSTSLQNREGISLEFATIG